MRERAREALIIALGWFLVPMYHLVGLLQYLFFLDSLFGGGKDYSDSDCAILKFKDYAKTELFCLCAI
jgi:hypothetical protein